MKSQACIFDLDGTLLDTLQDLANSVNIALEDFGQPVRTVEEVRAFVGNGVRKLMQRAVPEGTDEDLGERIYERFLEVYDREKNHYTKPYDGILELIALLKARGIACAVLSNKNDDAVVALCEAHFPNCFEFTQGMRPGVAPKPAPDALFALCTRMGINPEDAVYIGDSEVDVKTAQAAGMRLVAVTWGFRSREMLAKAGAKEMIDAPRELIEKL
ncbi:MAG: HAD family hydrolase [Peptococcaceae bacterium]|nr:HAD family hydrolase [Peptococcaceae bacterium]